MRRCSALRTLSLPVLLGLALLACDDGGSTGVDAGAAPASDAATGPPPPPPLTGLYRVAVDVTGGDCPADLLPATLTLDVDEADGRLAFQHGPLAFSGSRDGARLTLTASGEQAIDGCAQPVEVAATGAVRAPGNAFTLTATSTYAAACGRPACTLAWVGRAGRTGGHGLSAYTRLALAPTDEAVEAAAEFQGDAWFATSAPEGGRLWRLHHENGVPTLTAAIEDGFRREDGSLRGNNRALRSLLRTPDGLVVGTLDDPEAGGDGFDLWRFDGSAWSALTVDGFGDPAREAADALAWHDDALIVGVRGPGPEIWRAADPPVRLYPTAGAPGPATAAGPLDPLGCGGQVTSLLVFEGRLHAGLGGGAADCPGFVLRLDDDGWTLLSEAGLGVGGEEVALASDGPSLFALTGGDRPALLRWIADRQWLAVATDGFSSQGASLGARTLAAPTRGLLAPPGRRRRDSRRPVVASARILAGAAGATGHRARGPPSSSRSASTWGRGTGQPAAGLHAARRAGRRHRPDRARSPRGSRAGAGTACHRAAAFFSPALQHDLRAQVVLPRRPGQQRAPPDTLYVRWPPGWAPPGPGRDPRRPRRPGACAGEPPRRRPTAGWRPASSVAGQAWAAGRRSRTRPAWAASGRCRPWRAPSGARPWALRAPPPWWPGERDHPAGHRAHGPRPRRGPLLVDAPDGAARPSWRAETPPRLWPRPAWRLAGGPARHGHQGRALLACRHPGRSRRPVPAPASARAAGAIRACWPMRTTTAGPSRSTAASPPGEPPGPDTRRASRGRRRASQPPSPGAGASSLLLAAPSPNIAGACEAAGSLRDFLVRPGPTGVALDVRRPTR
ncbi:MAG: hypothetical protein R3F60_23895 [bacterium]